ncbi:MAG: hypothetical protein K8L97_18075 [Anaerolineae bacterium]|nr:hypothetical protein [Anaerolineae bacterium]
MDTFPRHYTIDRRTRIPQFIRAGLVLLVGVGIFIGLSRTSLDANLLTILRWIAGGIAFSGLLAILLLTIAAMREKGQVITVDETGLTVERPGKNKQSLKWADVTHYEVEDAGSLTGIWDSGYGSSSSTAGQGADDLIFGCLIGIILNVYLLVLEFFVRGAAWKVKFKLKTKRSLNVSGYGAGIDELVEKVLPHFLPDKRKLPGKPEKADDAPQN